MHLYTQLLPYLSNDHMCVFVNKYENYHELMYFIVYDHYLELDLRSE